MRKAGVLMPITSLPSPWGVGTMGAEARSFVDFLAQAGVAVWQILPLGPTSFGDSPYQSYSSFAGNPYLIDLDDLAAEGLLEKAEYAGRPWGSDPARVDYGALYRERFGVLAAAVERLAEHAPAELDAFCEREAAWLEDYALFMALKRAHGGAPWSQWEDGIRLREPAALDAARASSPTRWRFGRACSTCSSSNGAASRATRTPPASRLWAICPSMWPRTAWRCGRTRRSSSWMRTCGPSRSPAARRTASRPPSRALRPLFDWERMREDGYRWWIGRIAHQYKFYDILRIDHFRGFDSYYAIPAGNTTAAGGRWREGPGIGFFRAVEERLGSRPIVAEDLGFLTPSVHKLLADTGYPGMKLLQFAFDSRDGGADAYLPFVYPTNSVAYIGTHDNDTALGWLETAPAADTAAARAYLGLNAAEGEGWGLMRGILASPSDLAVLTMQDLLGLGSEARINTPSTLGGNWTWRALPGFATEELAHTLRDRLALYRRLPPEVEVAEAV